MKLSCTELSTLTGAVSISRETGWSVKRVADYLEKRGVRPSGARGYASCRVYPSCLVREAFRNVK